jgi:hypothetical protein
VISLTILPLETLIVSRILRFKFEPENKNNKADIKMNGRIVITANEQSLRLCWNLWRPARN